MSTVLTTLPAPDPRPAAYAWPRRWQDPPQMEPLPLAPPETHWIHDTQSADRRGSAAGAPAQLRTLVEALVRAVLEVVQGRRPATQLVRWVDDGALAEIALRTRGHRPDEPLSVCSVHLQPVSGQALEVAARVRAGHRSSAIAMRLVRRGRHWLCSDIDFGPMPPGLPLRP